MAATAAALRTRLSGPSHSYSNGDVSAGCATSGSARTGTVILEVDNDRSLSNSPFLAVAEPKTCAYRLTIAANQAYFGITAPPSPPPDFSTASVDCSSVTCSPPPPSPSPPPPGGTFAFGSTPPPPSPSPPPPQPPERNTFGTIFSSFYYVVLIFPLLIVATILTCVKRARARNQARSGMASAAARAESIEISSAAADGHGQSAVPVATATPVAMAMASPMVSPVPTAVPMATATVNVTVNVQQPLPSYSSMRDPGGPMPVDTTGDGVADSVVVDTTGDGRPDLVVPNPRCSGPAAYGAYPQQPMGGTTAGLAVVPGVAVPMDAPQVVSVTVPPGMSPGDVFTAQMPDGQLAQCQVPPGAGPGTSIQVHAPPPPMGSVVEAEVMTSV